MKAKSTLGSCLVSGHVSFSGYAYSEWHFFFKNMMSKFQANRILYAEEELWEWTKKKWILICCEYSVCCSEFCSYSIEIQESEKNANILSYLNDKKFTFSIVNWNYDKRIIKFYFYSDYFVSSCLIWYKMWNRVALLVYSFGFFF